MEHAVNYHIRARASGHEGLIGSQFQSNRLAPLGWPHTETLRYTHAASYLQRLLQLYIGTPQQGDMPGAVGQTVRILGRELLPADGLRRGPDRQARRPREVHSRDAPLSLSATFRRRQKKGSVMEFRLDHFKLYEIQPYSTPAWRCRPRNSSGPWPSAAAADAHERTPTSGSSRQRRRW